jgi:hypothetical protein
MGHSIKYQIVPLMLINCCERMYTFICSFRQLFNNAVTRDDIIGSAGIIGTIGKQQYWATSGYSL